MKPEEWMNTPSDFPMEYLTHFTIYRPAREPDPYNPDRWVDGEPEEVGMISGFLDVPLATELTDTGRSGHLTRARFYVPYGQGDARNGDTLQNVLDGAWLVVGRIVGNRNPFTDWRPVQIYDLQQTKG